MCQNNLQFVYQLAHFVHFSIQKLKNKHTFLKRELSFAQFVYFFEKSTFIFQFLNDKKHNR